MTEKEDFTTYDLRCELLFISANITIVADSIDPSLRNPEDGRINDTVVADALNGITHHLDRIADAIDNEKTVSLK
jgi:hypothetical protein